MNNCWNENIRLVPIFVLSVQYTWDRYTSICSSIKCPLEITADDYLVESNKLGSFDAIQAALIYRSMNNGLFWVTIFVTQFEITETLMTRLINGNASQYVYRYI